MIHVEDIEFAPELPKAREFADLARAVDGCTFIDDVPDDVPALWGASGGEILWAKGQPLMLVGPDGVGKTSLGQQLALARIGLHDRLLKQPVEQAAGKVLYIAADRPTQAASSMRRMVREVDRETLAQRLIVWKGPLPFELASTPRGLVQLCEELDVTDLFIDSLKDLQPDLVKDEIGSRVNIAIQELIASGRELFLNHHQRKEMNGGRKPKTLADVYGSRWLTAGMGSVVLLWGEPGDLVVEFRHLKQPVQEVGPLMVVHDHEHGRSNVHEGADLERMLENATYGLTVADAAMTLFKSATPTRNEIEKARRKLEALVKNEKARRRDDPDGLARYFNPQKAP